MPLGLKLAVLLVKLRTRLLGPLATLATTPTRNRPPGHDNAVDAAFHEVDTARDHLPPPSFSPAQGEPHFRWDSSENLAIGFPE
jgi:hypothetical protein